MNRRDALAALVGMPQVARVATVPEASTDVIVVKCDEYLDQQASAHIERTLHQVWPGRRILVLEKGYRLKVAPGA